VSTTIKALPATESYLRQCDSVLFFFFLSFLIITASFVTIQVFCKVLEKSSSKIAALKKIVDEGNCIPHFGEKADEICNSAIEEFALEAPVPQGDTNPEEIVDQDENEALYDKKVEELERLVDAPLHVLYLKQLTLARERALKLFRQTLVTAETPTNPANSGVGGGGVVTEYDAMMNADETFRREAEDFTRSSNGEWSYAKDAQLLKQSFQEVTSRIKKIQETKLLAAKQSQQAMSYLQMQQQQIQAIQQQMTVSFPFCILLCCFAHFLFLLLGRSESIQYRSGLSNSRYKFQFEL
jgi:hypothetical protein